MPNAYLAEVASLAQRVTTSEVHALAAEIVASHRAGQTVFIFGNGGSAATASHFACDLVKNTRDAEGRGVRAISLVDGSPLLTALANDEGYERVFELQLKNLGSPGDVAFAISGSGNSPNVLRAMEFAQRSGMRTLALAGFSGGHLAQLADRAVIVPGSRIQVVEDVHAMLCHALALSVARALSEPAVRSTNGLRPAVFCDRDGVLNVRLPAHVRSWSEFTFAPGALPGLRRLAALDLPVVVVTNQAIIGRGLIAAEEIAEIHRRVREIVKEQAGADLAFYVCPHAPEDSCGCRKPRPGLLERAAADLQLDLRSSVMIGDSIVDALAANSVGCRAIVIGEPEIGEAPLAALGVQRVRSFEEAVDVVVAGWSPAESERATDDN